MAKLPSVSGARLVRALKRAGFVVLRQKKAAMFRSKGVTPEKTYRTIVPQHSTLAKGTLSDILKQAGLSLEGLRELL